MPGRPLLRKLLASKPEAQAEYGRFPAAVGKDIDLPGPVLRGMPAGQADTRHRLAPGVSVRRSWPSWRGSPQLGWLSVSRGITQGWPRLPVAKYVQADIRDGDQLAAVFDRVRCDVVFHVAGQRDPGLAEHEVHRTVTTNVLGTGNVISAAASFGVPHVIFASTGKALRPYSGEVYTASKRVAEWLLGGPRCAGRPPARPPGSPT